MTSSCAGGELVYCRVCERGVVHHGQPLAARFRPSPSSLGISQSATSSWRIPPLVSSATMFGGLCLAGVSVMRVDTTGPRFVILADREGFGCEEVGDRAAQCSTDLVQVVEPHGGRFAVPQGRDLAQRRRGADLGDPLGTTHSLTIGGRLAARIR